MRTTMFLLIAALSGCSTLSDFPRRHPVAMAVGAVLITGSAVAIVEAQGHGHRPLCKPFSGETETAVLQRGC